MVADVGAYEALDAPLVEVKASEGAGRGVFATGACAAGETLTEYVGLLAATPESRSEDLALYQSFYGKNWRKYSQRYEIGLRGTVVADSAGLARGGTVAPFVGAEKVTCDPDEDLKACVTRATGSTPWGLSRLA